MKHFKFRKKSITLIWAVLLSVMLISCGQEDESPHVEGSLVPGEEFVWVPQFLSMDKEAFGDSGIRETFFANGRLYYRYFHFKKEAETWVNIASLEYRELEDMEMVHIPSVSFTLEGYDNQLSCYTLDEDGNLYVVWSSSPWYEEGGYFDYQVQQMHLIKYNAQGEQEKCICLNELFETSDIPWISGMVVDSDGSLYLSIGDAQIYVLDKRLKPEATIVTGAVSNLFLMGEDRVFAVRHNTHMELIELDKKSEKVKAVYGNIPASNGFFADGGNGKLLYAGTGKLYEYDLETQESVVVLNWVDSYVNGNYIQALQVLEDGRLALVSDDYENDPEVIFLTKTPRSEVKEKQALTLASFTGEDAQLQQKIIDFNRKNDTYEVQLKAYYEYSPNYSDTVYDDAVTQLYLDIISGDAPDIINLRDLDLNNLADSQVLEDLTPYLEKSTLANKTDFEADILEAYQIDGKQVTVPLRFWMHALFGKSSIVGAESGWTLEELIELREKYPDTKFMNPLDFLTKDNALAFCLEHGSDAFIDYEKGTCQFDSEEFIRVLEFANSFTGYGMGSRNLHEDLEKNNIVLVEEVLTDVTSYQVTKAIFEEPITTIGYPTGDGSPTVTLLGWEMYAICSRSDNKDGAWAFLESVLSDKKFDDYGGFPTRTSALEEYFAKAMEPEYQQDYVGNTVYDEQGNLIIVPKSNWSDSSGWSCEVYEATEEDIQGIRDMFSGAKAQGVHNKTIITMVQEEAAAYFAGQKTAQEVADIIQSRMEIYISENT